MAFTFGQKINTIVKLLAEPKVMAALLSQRDFGYLLDVGWFESFRSQKPVDKNGSPIPWFSYPFIDFLENRLSSEVKLLEFGSGNSTFYFGNRISKVYSIEHNQNWFEIVSELKPTNAELILTKSDSLENYLKPLDGISYKFDIIIIDGLHRNACIKKSVHNLSTGGVIILDDSERKEYKEGVDFLASNKFRRLDFWGIAPTVLFKKCTSLFYKHQNCLGV